MAPSSYVSQKRIGAGFGAGEEVVVAGDVMVVSIEMEAGIAMMAGCVSTRVEAVAGAAVGSGIDTASPSCLTSNSGSVVRLVN